MSDQPEKRTYEEILSCLPDSDIAVIEAEMMKRNNQIGVMKRQNDALGVIVAEYYNSIGVLNANSERIMMTLKASPQT